MIIFYTNRFIPSWAAGCTRGPFILIRPIHREDSGLRAHERVHVRQWFRSLGLHPLFYALSSSYRLKAEVEAYREQLKYYVDDRALRFAEFIATRYKLNVTAEQAFLLLKC